MEKVKKYKEKAEYFLEYDIKAFIKDSNDQFYFCDIINVGETHLYIENFTGHRKGIKNQILWIDIEVFNEYKEKGDLE